MSGNASKSDWSKCLENMENVCKTLQEEFLPEIRRTIITARELKDENNSLKIKVQEIMELLGEILVKNDAKDNDEKKSERFQQMFPSSLPKAQTTSAASPAMNASADHTAAIGQRLVKMFFSFNVFLRRMHSLDVNSFHLLIKYTQWNVSRFT